VTTPALSPTPPATRDALYAFAYQESVRGLAQQGVVLDNIRTRAGLVITAANVVTALLAAPAIKDRGITVGGAAALVTFGLAAFFSVRMLLPQHGWNFRFSAAEIIDRVDSHPEETLASIQKKLARLNDSSYDENQRRIDTLFSYLKWASAFLFVEAALWLVVLAKWSIGGISL
jgi:hypothetical protein